MKKGNAALDRQVEDDSLDLATQWMTGSGIQAEEGGFYAWYDLDNNVYPFLYSEITGYAITTFVFLKKFLHDEIFIKRAEKAAQWIIANAMNGCPGIKTKLYTDDDNADRSYSFSGGNIYSFDTGMVLYGMINLYKACGKVEFLESSRRIADFLVKKMRNDDGSFCPVFNVHSRSRAESCDKWSNQRGAFHAKISLGLIDLFHITGNDEYREAAINLCNYALGFQDKTGMFTTGTNGNTFNLHPYCYAIEGVLYTGAALGIEKFIDAADRANQWMFKKFFNGELFERYNPSTKNNGCFPRSDVLAQALRLGLIFSIEDEKIEELKSLLLHHQYCQEGDPHNGGFFYNRNERHINSWCTMFSIQALALYENRALIPEDQKIELFI